MFNATITNILIWNFATLKKGLDLPQVKKCSKLGATHISIFPMFSAKLTLEGEWVSTCDTKIIYSIIAFLGVSIWNLIYLF